jgi:hypothetical protein
MDQSPSWEASWFSARQEIPRILWKPEDSLPHSQVPATCSYPEPARSNPYPHILLSSFFRCLSHTRLSAQVRGFSFLGWGVVSTSPNSQAGGTSIVGCPQLFIQYIRSYPPYWRLFFHPQPEDAPCRSDTDSLITASAVIRQRNSSWYLIQNV